MSPLARMQPLRFFLFVCLLLVFVVHPSVIYRPSFSLLLPLLTLVYCTLARRRVRRVCRAPCSSRGNLHAPVFAVMSLHGIFFLFFKVVSA